MKNSFKTIATALVLGLLGGMIAIGLFGGGHSFGGTVENFPTWFYNGLKAGNGSTAPFQIGSNGSVTIGTSGTATTKQINTTCFLLANFSIAATTTRNVDCAVTGVTAGDMVDATLAATTTMAGQYVIQSVQASTTAGFVTFSLLNLTGQSAVPAATNGFGSTTVVFITR